MVKTWAKVFLLLRAGAYFMGACSSLVSVTGSMFVAWDFCFT